MPKEIKWTYKTPKLGVYSEQGIHLLSNTDDDTTFAEFSKVYAEIKNTMTENELQYMIFYLVRKHHMKNSEFQRYIKKHGALLRRG